MRTLKNQLGRPSQHTRHTDSQQQQEAPTTHGRTYKLAISDESKAMIHDDSSPCVFSALLMSGAFPIPQVHRDTGKREVERLVEIRVLKPIQESEWAFPSFIIPKKSKEPGKPGTVRFLSDLRELNKRVARKPYPLPKISTVLQELEGF